jgi:hypothetical protein
MRPGRPGWQRRRRTGAPSLGGPVLTAVLSLPRGSLRTRLPAMPPRAHGAAVPKAPDLRDLGRDGPSHRRAPGRRQTRPHDSRPTARLAQRELPRGVRAPGRAPEAGPPAGGGGPRATPALTIRGYNVAGSSRSMEVKQRRKPDDLTDAIAQLILSRERDRPWLRLAPGWEKWLGGIATHRSHSHSALPVSTGTACGLLGGSRTLSLGAPRKSPSRRAAPLGAWPRVLAYHPESLNFLAVSRPPPPHDHLTQEFRTVASWRIRPARCDERGA